MSQSFTPGTVLGERYKVINSIAETTDGDIIFDGQDQVLGRKVSVIIAGTGRGEKLLSNARAVAASPRSNVQILDLGQSDNITYLVASHTRPAILTESLLDANAARKASDTSALGEHIFGDTASTTNGNTYVEVKPEKQARRAEPIEASKPVAATTAASAGNIASEPAYLAADSSYDPEEFDVEPEEEEESGPGMWLIAVAAIILLLIGAAVVYSQLGHMVNKGDQASPETSTSAPATSAPSSASASASPSPTGAKKLPAPKIDGVSRLVPANPTLMADQDGTLGQMTDGNTATQWMSYGFGSPNFGGLVDSFALSYELTEETTVNELTINQVSGTGGSFTVFTNSTNSLDGATEVGSGTFNAAEVTTKLATDDQKGETKFVIVRFDEAPTLAQPITPQYIYGLRLAEVSVK